MASKKTLTLKTLREQAASFARIISRSGEPELFGVTDGKAVGTHLERRFFVHLKKGYAFTAGSSASGIDLPGINVDIKATSIRQPQSSCPFKSARQKIYGLGYHLVIFVYEKTDNAASRTGRLNIMHAIFVHKNRTADYQITCRLAQIMANDGNADDITAFLLDRNLPIGEIEAQGLAEEILRNPPQLGCLAISNAMQWRLHYSRAIAQAGAVAGIGRMR